MSEKVIVTFYDEDRQTVLDKQEVERGTSVKYAGKIPEKPAENGISYDFVGWETTGDIKKVMENINLYAKYDESTKASSKNIDEMYVLSEQNAEQAKLNEVMQAGKKVISAENATRNMSLEEKQNLVNEVIEKGSIDLGKEKENERD